MKESAYNDTLQNLQRQFHEYREAYARVRRNLHIGSSTWPSFQEQINLIEKAETAYQLQIKAQKTAEEAISHLRAYMKEQGNIVRNENVQLFIIEHRSFSLSF